MTCATPSAAARAALFFAAGAGAVDAIVIAGFQVLTAAQTGNTILLAVALAQGDWRTGLNSAVSVSGFVLGALGGSLVLSRAAWGVARLAALEILVLAAALALWLVGRAAGTAVAPGVIFAVAAAMGMQSAAMLHLRAGSTTYVTGVLATFARDAVAPRVQGVVAAGFEARVWFVYFCGAICGAWLFFRAGPAAMIASIALLAVAAVMASRPDVRG